MFTYRPNAAVIVTDGNGKVLLCERADRPGAVQAVQGGIDAGETAEQAARREMWEEIGLDEEQYELIGALPEPLRYTWPEEVRTEFWMNKIGFEGWVGQEQSFFLVRVSTETPFVLDKHHQEFSSVRWGTPQELVEGCWEYKREVLEQALKGFGLL
jgi:putative (di)nucleoside polyphosphate hydrolase